MRAVGSIHSPKAHSLVEPRGLGIRGPQAQILDPSASGCDDFGRDALADAAAPMRRQYIEVSNPADVARRGVGIDVQPADADELLTVAGDEERLAGPVESIDTRGPLVGQPPHEAQAVLLALGD